MHYIYDPWPLYAHTILVFMVLPLPEFSKNYHVVAIDLRRAMGKQTDPAPNKGDYTIVQLTQDIVELIPALGY